MGEWGGQNYYCCVGEEEGKPLKGPFDGMAVVSRSIPNCCNCSPEGGTQQNRFSQVVSE